MVQNTTNASVPTTTTTTTWSDEMGSRGRGSWLLLIKGEEVVVFKGGDLPGVAVVRGTDYCKNGKWSHTTYRLELAPGVRPIPGKDGWETGRFAEGLRPAVGYRGPIDTWIDLGMALGISVPSAMKFLRAWRPKAAERFDEVDARLSALDDVAEAAEATADTETVVVSFGGPTRAQRAEGFWTNSKPIPGHAGELRLLDPEKGWETANITVSGIAGTVLNAVTAPGHGGGYVSVTVAVVPGTEFDDPAPVAPLSAEEVSEREALKDLLAHRNVREDLPTARKVDAFVKKAIALRGRDAARILRQEEEERYGRGARQAAIAREFPGLDVWAIDLVCGGDIVPAADWAEKVAKEAPAPPPSAPKAEATTPIEPGSMGALLAKYGKKR